MLIFTQVAERTPIRTEPEPPRAGNHGYSLLRGLRDGSRSPGAAAGSAQLLHGANHPSHSRTQRSCPSYRRRTTLHLSARSSPRGREEIGDSPAHFHFFRWIGEGRGGRASRSAIVPALQTGAEGTGAHDPQRT